MITKLTKQGSSWVLVIDEPVLDAMQIDPETTALRVSATAETLTIVRAAETVGSDNITADVQLS